MREEKIKIRFGLPACQAYSNMLLADDNEKYFSGVDLLALGMAKLLLAAYENQCVIDDKQPTLTLGVFMEYIEDVLTDDPKEAERIIKVFTDSRYTQVMVEKYNNYVEEAEKKSQSIGSSSSRSRSVNLASLRNSTMNAHSGSSILGNKGTKGNNSKSKKKKRN